MIPTPTWTFDRATNSQALVLPGGYTVALCGTSSGNPPGHPAARSARRAAVTNWRRLLRLGVGEA